jgi:hypothetical protein
VLVALKLPLRWQRLRRPGTAARSTEQRWEDRLQATGQLFHETRCQRSQTIEELSRLTHIQPRIIRALEQADLTLLPEPVYIRGLVRRYGDVLGLNGTSLAESVFQTPQRPRRKVETSSLPMRVESWQLYLLYLMFVLMALHLLNWLVTRNAQEFAAEYQPIPVLPNAAFLVRSDRPTPEAYFEALPLHVPLIRQFEIIPLPKSGQTGSRPAQPAAPSSGGSQQPGQKAATAAERGTE